MTEKQDSGLDTYIKVLMRRELKTAFQIRCLERGEDMSAVVRELIAEYMDRTASDAGLK